MRALYLALLATAIITIGADYGLQYVGFSAAEQASGGSVRLE